MKNNIKSDAGKILTLAAYPVIWTACLAYFWISRNWIDAAGYSIFVLWLIIPITTFAVSFFIAKSNYIGKIQWLSPILLGVMYMLAEYLSFSLLNMVTFIKFNQPELKLIIYGTLISTSGLFTGYIFNIHKKRKGE